MNKIYDRQNTDTDKSFAAFAVYRDMGRDRTLEKVRLTIGRGSVRSLEMWSSRYQWVKRCSAFDSDEFKAQSKALQNQRLKQRLQLEKDAWALREKILRKADQLLSIPIVTKTVSADGTQIFMPTDKWRLADAIALSKYADELALFASGGEPKKLDVVEAVTALADMGLLPAAAVVAISEGFSQFKNVIRDSLRA